MSTPPLVAFMANVKKVQLGETIDEWLHRVPEPQQTSLRWLRSLLMPVEGLKERVKWAHPCYVYRGVDVFSLTWSTNHVNLQLWKGAHLPNPHSAIEGTGKDARHIKVKNGQERPAVAVEDAIEASLRFADNLNS